MWPCLEYLYMHQLGVEKCAVKAFELLIKGRIVNQHGKIAKKQTNITLSLDKISKLAYKYGGMLSRQSERNLPRTKFGTYILNTSQKEGHEYAGIVLNLLIAIVLDEEREILFNERSMMKERI